MTKRNWKTNIADLLSGRIYNSLVSLNQRVKRIGEYMSRNEEIITGAAQSIRQSATDIGNGVQALRDRIAELEGVEVEDLSDELAALDSAVASLHDVSAALTPASPGTPSEGTPAGSNTSTDASAPIGGPIAHEDIPATPLAGSSGPTDARVPTTQSQPGNVNTDPPMTPTHDEIGEPTPAPEEEETATTSDTVPAEEAPASVPAETAPAVGTFDEDEGEDDDADEEDDEV